MFLIDYTGLTCWSPALVHAATRSGEWCDAGFPAASFTPPSGGALEPAAL
jgi:hypothetical protein